MIVKYYSPFSKTLYLNSDPKLKAFYFFCDRLLRTADKRKTLPGHLCRILLFMRGSSGTILRKEKRMRGKFLQFRLMRIIAIIFSIAIGYGCAENTDDKSDWEEELAVGSSTVTISSNYFNSDGSCKEDPIFPLVDEAYGYNELIRDMIFDDASNTLYYATLHGFYRYSGDEELPELVTQFDNLYLYKFWRSGQYFIFSGNTLDGQNSLIKLLSIDGNEVAPRLIYKEDTDFSGDPQSIQVVGKTVYWIQRRTVAGDGEDEDIVVWSIIKSTIDVSEINEGNIDIIYSAPEGMSLGDGVYAADAYYVNLVEERGDEEFTWHMELDPETGEIRDEDTLSSRNGFVLDGDEQSVLFFRSAEVIEGWFTTWESERRFVDDSETIIMDDNLLDWLQRVNHYAMKESRWAWLDWGAHDSTAELDNFYLFTHIPNQESQFIGCVNERDTTTHAVAIGADAVYVSIFRDSNNDGYSNGSATILKYSISD